MKERKCLFVFRTYMWIQWRVFPTFYIQGRLYLYVVQTNKHSRSGNFVFDPILNIQTPTFYLLLNIQTPTFYPHLNIQTFTFDPFLNIQTPTFYPNLNIQTHTFDPLLNIQTLTFDPFLNTRHSLIFTTLVVRPITIHPS